MSTSNTVTNITDSIYNKDFKIDSSFKETFTKEMSHYLVGIKIKDTDLFIKKYKNHIFKYKNYSPIQKQVIDETESNKIVTKYSHLQAEEFEAFLKVVSKENLVFLLNHELFSFVLTYKNFSIEEIISKLLGENLSKEFPKSFEIIGNIAHMNIREEYLKYKYLIGALILDVSILSISIYTIYTYYI